MCVCACVCVWGRGISVHRCFRNQQLDRKRALLDQCDGLLHPGLDDVTLDRVDQALAVHHRGVVRGVRPGVAPPVRDHQALEVDRGAGPRAGVVRVDRGRGAPAVRLLGNVAVRVLDVLEYERTVTFPPIHTSTIVSIPVTMTALPASIGILII